MKTRVSPESAREPVEEPLLPAPEGRTTEEWTEKAEKAQEARALGRKLRKGKRILFSSRHHLSG